MQPINRWITRKMSGRKGAPIYNDFADRKEDKESIAKSIDNKLIAENDYNLSVSSYVETKETRQETNIKELNERICKIVARENELRSEIEKIITELEDNEL